MRKKFLNVIAISALVGLGAIGLASCNQGAPTEVPNDEDDKETPKTYTVTYDSGNFTITGLSTSGYKEGDKVTFKVTPTGENEITSVKVGSTTLTAGTNGEYSFVMGTENVKIVVTTASIAKEFSLDVKELTLDELGKKGVITATMENIEGTIAWTCTDEVNFKLTPSADGTKCEVENLGGGEAVVTATIGTFTADVFVKGSTFGDTRGTYTIYKTDGTVLLDDVKGLYNAIGKLNKDTTVNDGYVTAKGETTKLYTRDNAWLTAVAKDGPTTETNGLTNWVNDKVPAWVSGYPTQQVDELKEANIITTQKESGNFNYFDQRATNWFFDDPLADGFHGYSGSVGQQGVISGNLWSGWRASEYKGAITGVQYISWADPYQRNQINMSWDLSNSLITPSLNEDQGVFAQIYLGSANRIPVICGMYFDAGTIEECAELEDGATRNIYTFKETLDKSGGLTTGKLGVREIGTTAIGEAKWDAFNKAWSFDDFTLEIENKIFYLGEDPENPTKTYYRTYEITGLKGGEEVAAVNYEFNFTDDGAADPSYTGTRAGSSERTIYGATFTPKYGTNELADITCGAKWTNVLQTTSTAYSIADADGVIKEDNLQFLLGRTVNQGCQTALMGADCLTGTLTSDEESLFNFAY